VEVTVTTPGGTSNGVFFTYLPVPTLTTVVPNSGPEAGGQSVLLTGTDLAWTTDVTFGTTPAPFTGLSDTQTLTTSPAGTGTVLVSIPWRNQQRRLLHLCSGSGSLITDGCVRSPCPKAG
jgi:hypothetical protein